MRGSKIIMKDLLQSSKIRKVLWWLGAVIAALLVFWLGTAVGYRAAFFDSRFGENYYRNFYGDDFNGGGMIGGPGPMARGSFDMHGVAGEVIDVATDTISVKDPGGNELSVVVPTSTVIREGNNTIAIGAIKIGNGVAVIGAPNDAGQIQARFIRVFPVPPAVPASSQ